MLLTSLIHFGDYTVSELPSNSQSADGGSCISPCCPQNSEVTAPFSHMIIKYLNCN